MVKLLVDVRRALWSRLIQYLSNVACSILYSSGDVVHFQSKSERYDRLTCWRSRYKRRSNEMESAEEGRSL